MKKLITSSLVLFCVSLAVAQTTNDEYYSPAKPKLSLQDRVTTSITMGTGVSFLGSTNSTAFTTYVAPKINYQLTNKFKLNVGLMHYTMTGNTFMPLNYHEGLLNTSNKSISGNLIFVGGEYQLNNKVILSGAVMADANSISKNQLTSKAAAFGVEYKVSPHSSIKMETIISSGQGNYINNANSPGLFPFTEANMFGTGFSNLGNTPVIR